MLKKVSTLLKKVKSQNNKSEVRIKIKADIKIRKESLIPLNVKPVICILLGLPFVFKCYSILFQICLVF